MKILRKVRAIHRDSRDFLTENEALLCRAALLPPGGATSLRISDKTVLFFGNISPKSGAFWVIFLQKTSIVGVDGVRATRKNERTVPAKFKNSPSTFWFPGI